MSVVHYGGTSSGSVRFIGGSFAGGFGSFYGWRNVTGARTL
jgi:hypothetical protein